MNAYRDDNRTPSLLAVSNADGITPVTLYADPTTHRLLVSSTSGGATTALDNLAAVAINAALLPGTSDSIALGSATKQWSDLFLGEGAVINWDGGDVTLTQTNNVLAIAGATSLTLNTGDGTVGFEDVTGSANSDAGVTFSAGATFPTAIFTEVNGTIASFGINVTQIGSRDTAVDGFIFRLDTRVAAPGFFVVAQPAGGSETERLRIAPTGEMYVNGPVLPKTSDVAALGSATLMWGDLFLALGSVVNFNNGNVTLTHSAGVLTLGGTATLALGANSLTMTGSIAATGARVTKGWFTDLESTNMPTVGGTALLTSLTAPQFTTIELGASSDTTLARVSAGVASIEGVNILTVAGGTLTGNLTLGENTAIALDPAGSADEKWSGITCTGTAGATVAVGDLLYLDVTAGEWLLADADAAATSGDVPLGLCILAANDGGATNLLLVGTMRSAAFPASIALGAPVYVGVTAGDIQATQPSGTDDVIRRVGWAITVEPNSIYFNPSNDYVSHV